VKCETFISSAFDLGRCTTIAVLFFAFSSTESFGISPVPEEIIAAVKQQETCFLSLKLSGVRVRSFTSGSVDGPWEKSLRLIDGDVWINASRGGLYRFKINREVSPWEQGVAPAIENSKDLSFDGEQERGVTHSARHLGSDGGLLPGVDSSVQFPARIALVTGVSEQLRRVQPYAMMFHARTSICFFYDNLPQMTPLSDELERMRLADRMYVDVPDASSPNVVRVMARKDGLGRQLFLDSTRGYALLRYVETAPPDAGGHVTRMGSVELFKEIQPGVFFPLKSTVIEQNFGSTSSKFIKYVSEAEDVVVDDTLDGTAFSSPIPDGYLVTDHISNEVYRAGSGPNERRVAISDVVKQGKAVLGASQTDNTTPSKPAWNSMAALLAVVGGILLVGFWVLRSRRRSSSLACALAGFFLLGPLTLPEVRAQDQPLPTNYRVNCGLDAALTVMEWFGVPIGDPAEITNALELNSDLSNETSFERISSVLVARNCSVAGFGATSVAELASAVNGVAIIHVEGEVNGKKRGHFVVAVPRGNQFLIFDGTHSPKLVERVAAAKGVLSSARNFLIVTPPQSTGSPSTSSVPAGDIRVEPPQVDLGQRTYSEGDVSVEVRVRNNSSVALHLTAPERCCGAPELQVSGEAIPPRGSGIVKAKFSQTTLRQGVNRRSIRVLTDNAATKELVIPVSFEVVMPAVLEATEMVPERIVLPRQRRVAGATRRNIVIKVPESLSIEAPVVTLEKGDVLVSATPGVPRFDPRQKQWNVEVTLVIGPPSELRVTETSIVFNVKSSNGVSSFLSLPIKGEWVD